MEKTNENIFLELQEKELNTDLLMEVSEFQNKCLNEKDYLYYYEATLLLIKITIHINELNDALNLSLDIYSSINSEEFPQQYKKILDNLVYIYITKQYYQRALQICLSKKDYLDVKNNDEVNRWYLELAYINDAIGKKNDSLRNLNLILSNNPDKETEAICLNDITKIYIDNKNIIEAKESLNKCIALVNEINDAEGIRYCDYLKAKILILEKNYNGAYKLLNGLVTDLDVLETENFNYLNEYLSLLCLMDLYQEGLKLSQKYYELVEKSDDLQNKLSFYTNCLRIQLSFCKQKKNSFLDYNTLFKKITTLEEEINRNKDIKSIEIKEDEIYLESNNSEKNLTRKLLDGLNSLTYDSSSLRGFLLNYSKSIIDKVPMDEIVYVLFTKDFMNVLLDEPLNDKISCYQFKNNRLYDRKLSYDDLNNTVILKVMEENKTIILNSSKNEIEYYDPINKGLYKNLNINNVYATPLTNNDMVFGICVFTSRNNSFIENYNAAFLSLSSKLFNQFLINELQLEHIYLEKDLFKKATDDLNYGLFYYYDDENIMVFSDVLKKIFNCNKCVVNVKDFNEYVCKEDLNEYLTKNEFINKRKEYKLSYHVKVNDEVFLVKENAKPFVKNDNIYYVGTIEKVVIDKTIKNELKNNDFKSIENLKLLLDESKDKRHTFLCFSTNYKFTYSELYNTFESLIFKDKDIYIIDKDMTCSQLEKLFTSSLIYKTVVKTNSINYTILDYPKTLMRLDDLYPLYKYLLNNFNNKVEFNNEVYANFISCKTISSSVVKALSEDDIKLVCNEVTLDNQLIGYNITPCINGVFNYDSLSVVENDLMFELDSHVINMLRGNDFISFYNIRMESLLRLCDNKLISNEDKLIFNIIDYLKNTKCKIIINSTSFNDVNLNNLNNNSNVILGFNEKLMNILETSADTFLDVYHYFNKPGGLKVSKEIKKIEEIEK